MQWWHDIHAMIELRAVAHSLGWLYFGGDASLLCFVGETFCDDAVTGVGTHSGVPPCVDDPCHVFARRPHRCDVSFNGFNGSVGEMARLCPLVPSPHLPVPEAANCFQCCTC